MKAQDKVFVSVVLVVFGLIALATPLAVDAVAAQGVNTAPVAVASVQADEPPVSPVELPLELRVLLAGGIGFLVTAGLKSLSTLLKSDITGWAAVITGGLTTSVIFFFNAILSTIPPEAQPSATIALALVVSILSAFGVARTAKKMQPAEAKK